MGLRDRQAQIEEERQREEGWKNKGGRMGKREIFVLTSDAGPLSAPGQEKVTNSWQRLCTTKQQTERRKERERQMR